MGLSSYPLRILALLLALAATPAWGQAAFEAVGDADAWTGTAGNLTLAGFNAGGAANSVFVCVGWYAQVGAGISSVTYAGNDLTQVGPAVNGAGDSNVRAHLWQYTAASAAALPDTGDVVVTMTTGSNYLSFGALSFSNVDEGTPTDAQIAENNTETPALITVPTSDDDVVIDCGYIGAVQSVQGDNIERWNNTHGNAESTFASTADEAASADMSWNGGGYARAHIAANINGAIAAPPGPSIVILRRRRGY